MAQFGEILAELRQDRKLTQRDLAKILFVSAGTISNYEKGVHFPDMEKLINLANYFEVSTDYLLGRCSSRESTDVFKQDITDTMTLGDFVQSILRLTADRKQALALLVSDMELSAMISSHHKGEHP